MIDWITASVVSENVLNRVSPGFDTGRFMKVLPSGEIEQNFSARLQSPGSFDDSLSFRAPYPHQLEMSGNPAKFIQGHNLFGSDDWINLYFAAGAMTAFNSDDSPFPVPMSMYGLLWRDNGKKPPLHELSELRATRLDLTRSYRFASNEEARAWLRSVGASGHSRHRIKNNLTQEGTVYYGKNSSRWAFKIYQKFDEITSGKKGHALSSKLSIEDSKHLIEWAEGVVRFELTLRRPEIEKLKSVFDTLDVWKNYYDKIQFNENSRGIDMSQLNELSPRLKHLYISWQSGVDIREDYSKAGFYKVRRNLLDALGVDISVPPLKDESPLVLELKDSGWDPTPIEELMVTDFGQIGKESYGF